LDPVYELPYGPAASDGRNRGRTDDGLDYALHYLANFLAPAGASTDDPKKRAEIAESVLSGRKSAAEMARLYDISQPTVSRIVAAHRTISSA